uniref:Transthyretin-like family protein n=1 Tax=Panagrellus redivivus TaxID=6233 RepID=A0A7E4V7H6_PANRE
MTSMYLNIIILYCLVIAALGFRTQSTSVKGRLVCGTVPQKGVLVRLFDEDDGPDPDDQLDTTYTDDDGYFELAGDTVEFTNIDPEIRIYHNCNNYINPCERAWIIGIPDKYISSGKTPKVTMDMGTMNLEVELEDEGHDCIH